MQAIKITIETKNREKGNYSNFFVLPDNLETKKRFSSCRNILNFARENFPHVNAYGIKGQTSCHFVDDSEIEIICKNKVIAKISIEKINNAIFI